MKIKHFTAPGSDGLSYSVYKKLWSIVGPFILAAWDYSCIVGHMPPSHKEYIIVLLPKEGKDASDIKNWRPLTLSNCDAKIITKLLTIRMSKVLDEVIDINQSAYISGRSVSDNLLSIMFMKDYCCDENIEAVLISLDAKKAFDSVDHRYIETTLEQYGFGQNFINYFRVLYKDLTARILINGYQSELIKILRGVKQGDALSCSIFIICIDPLLRNINADPAITAVEVKTRISKKTVNYKAGAFADDVDVICGKDDISIQAVFTQYEKLSRRSGLELNAEKTEILSLKSSATISYNINYMGINVPIKTIPKVKICGLWFCNNKLEEYKLNISDKILKLESMLKSWRSRNLTYEGKSLIIKTFGLSQLIYVLQVYNIKDECIKRIESSMFGFIWLGQRSNKERGVDRIKRSVLKNAYIEGGLNVTDMSCLNRSLKLRQFMRAWSADHPIKTIQRYCLENCGYSSVIMNEYERITSREAIVSRAQSTINI